MDRDAILLGYNNMKSMPELLNPLITTYLLCIDNFSIHFDNLFEHYFSSASTLELAREMALCKYYPLGSQVLTYYVEIIILDMMIFFNHIASDL